MIGFLHSPQRPPDPPPADRLFHLGDIWRLPRGKYWQVDKNVRTNSSGTREVLILPPDHEAPFWADLRQIAQRQARSIHEPR
jgi:hypothetical protein